MRVKKFQQVEETQGRHVAVIVTSRVTVADRMQLPAGVLAVRLEPFEIGQVEEWLTAWNETNESSAPRYLADGYQLGGKTSYKRDDEADNKDAPFAVQHPTHAYYRR